jgi:hypothetical protein
MFAPEKETFPGLFLHASKHACMQVPPLPLTVHNEGTSAGAIPQGVLQPTAHLASCLMHIHRPVATKLFAIA